MNRFTQENEKWFEHSAESTKVEAINAPMLDMIANLGTVAIMWYGGWLVIENQMSLGELVAFTTYLAMLIRPIRLMGRIIPHVCHLQRRPENVFSVLDAPVEVADLPDATLPRLSGRVAFQDVSFHYRNKHAVFARHQLFGRSGSDRRVNGRNRFRQIDADQPRRPFL